MRYVSACDAWVGWQAARVDITPTGARRRCRQLNAADVDACAEVMHRCTHPCRVACADSMWPSQPCALLLTMRCVVCRCGVVTPSLLLGLFYSADVPLLRWKRSPFLAAACIFGVRALAVQFGFYFHMTSTVLARCGGGGQPCHRVAHAQLR
jgi:hypothetical protein